MLTTTEEYIKLLEYSHDATIDNFLIQSIIVKHLTYLNSNEIIDYDELISIHYLLGICNNLLSNIENSITHFKFILDTTKNRADANIIKGKCYLSLSRANFLLQDFDLHNYYFSKAKINFISESNYCDLTKLYMDKIIGMLKFNSSTEEIKPYLDKVSIYIDLFENEHSAQFYMKLGMQYSVYFKDNYYCIELYKKASILAYKYNLNDLKPMISYYIGVGYVELDRYTDACKIFNDLLSNSYNLTPKLKCILSLELIFLYIQNNMNLEEVEALFIYNENCLRLLNESDRLQFKSQLLLNKCKYALLTNNQTYDSLITFINEVQEIYNTFGVRYNFSHTDFEIEDLLGDIHYKFNYYEKALEHHKKALALTVRYEVKYSILANRNVAKDYAALNNYTEAYNYMNTLDNLQGNIQHAELLENYSKVYNEYEALKQAEINKNLFFANLSHELKTPINIIYSSIQLLNLFKDNSDHMFKQYYSKHEKSISQNCLRILKLVDNLIDSTKIDSGNLDLNFANYDIIKLTEDITLSTLPYVEIKKLNITFDTEIEELTIKCDPYSIERILLNLLSNAIKFTSEGGNINVLISSKDEYVEIKINDDGIGIPSYMKDRIFHKFIQIDTALNRKKEGSGIGLSIVKSLVHLHNGIIYLNTSRSVGSEFIILLPNVLCTDNVDVTSFNNYTVNNENVFAELSDIYELTY